MSKAEAAAPAGGGYKDTLSRNATVTLAAKVLYMITRLFLPPLILAYVTLEEYGIWAISFILVSYLGMSAFGVANVYIRYVAEFHARGERESINRLISTGIVSTGVMSAVLLTGLWFLLPYIIRLLNVSEQFFDVAFILLFGTAATLMMDLTLGACAYVLHGMQRITEQQIVWVITFCLEAVFIVLFLYWGMGINGLLLAFVLRYVISTVVYVVLAYRAIPGLSISPRHFDRESLRLFYSYGAVVQISGFLGMFLYSLEKTLAGVFVGVKATGLLDVAEKFPVMASQLPSSLNSLFLPAIAQLKSGGRGDKVLELYVQGARYMNIASGLIMGFFAVFSAPILTAWIGVDDRLRMGAIIMTVATLPYQLHILTGPASAFHRGSNPWRELAYPLVQLALIAAMLPLGFMFFGKEVLTILWVVAIGMVLSALFYISFTNRFLSISTLHFFRRVIGPGVVPYFVAVGVYLAGHLVTDFSHPGRWYLLGQLAIFGTVYGLLSVICIFWGIFKREERHFFLVQVIRLSPAFLNVKESRIMAFLWGKPEEASSPATPEKERKS